MRRVSVVVALALAGCSFSLQPNPKHVAVEATFPAAAPITELPAQFKVATFNVHKEAGAKIAGAIRADRELRDADLIMMQEVPRWGTECSGACELGRALGMYAVFAPGHVEGDKDMGVATRKRIFDMVSADKIAVVGYHMPFPSVGFIDKTGAGYRWAPASYQFNL
jgi:hypothetical protein